MEPEPPTEQSPTTPADEIPNEPSPQPPTLRPWEVPFAQTATPQQGQPPRPLGGVASPPRQRSRIGLIVGVIAVVFVVAVIAAGVLGFLLLRDTITAATKPRTSSVGPTPPMPSTATAAPATVIVDGQALPIRFSATCAKAGGDISISVDASQGIAVVLTDTNPPQVKAVSLGTINGLTLAYSGGVGHDGAVVTEDGNTFKISGTAAGVDTSHGVQVVKKPFEIDVTCPHL